MYFAKPQIYDRTAPVISGATAETKAVLTTIRNTNRQILIGSQKEASVIQALSGRLPVLYGFEYQDGQTANTAAIVSAYNSGAMIGISDHMPNFVTYAGMGGYSHAAGSNPQSNGCYDKSQNVLTEILPGGSKNAAFLAYVDAVCTWLSSLVGADGKKIPVLWRPLHEANGDWFWWHNKTGAAQYVTAFQYYVDRMRANGVTNALIVWCPTVNTVGGTLLYYADINPFSPGATYCDVVGLDIYSNAAGGSLRHGWVRSGYAAAEQIAGELNKPMGLAEIGFQNSAWNWSATTESFWDVVVLRQIKAEMPAVRYAMFWNDVFAPGVGKSTSDGAVRMLADPYCVLR